jgi:seryl-tRNA synthetase
MKRIALLEADKTMEKIRVLKGENTTLKKQVEDLKVELKQVSQECSKSSNPQGRQDTKSEQKVTKSSNQQVVQDTKSEQKVTGKSKQNVTGNKGYLLKK